MRSADHLLSTRKIHETWIPMLELAIREVFERMLGSQLDLPADETREQPGITAMVGLAGQVCGVMSIRCDTKTACRMASQMLGAERGPKSAELQDAFGEICNMVAGNFKNKITGMNEKCMLSNPTVVTGSDYRLRSLSDSDSIEITMLFERLPFTVSLEIHS